MPHNETIRSPGAGPHQPNGQVGSGRRCTTGVRHEGARRGCGTTVRHEGATRRGTTGVRHEGRDGGAARRGGTKVRHGGARRGASRGCTTGVRHEGARRGCVTKGRDGGAARGCTTGCTSRMRHGGAARRPGTEVQPRPPRAVRGSDATFRRPWRIRSCRQSLHQPGRGRQRPHRQPPHLVESVVGEVRADSAVQ